MPVGLERDEDEGWETVVFQFEVADPDYVLSLSRTLAPDAQDVAAGTDTVCVTYYGASAYGAVRRWEQPALDEIRLTLSPEAAAELQLEEVTEFNVEDVDDLTAPFELVRAMLAATGELRD